MTAHGSLTLDRLVEAYSHHQRRTRGLRPQTLRSRARLVRMLVRASLGEDPVEPARLAPADVVTFITSLRGRFSPGSMRTVRSTLRSFFRFLRFEGFCGDELEAALPAVAHWRLATLPRSLTDQQVQQVLGSFDAPTSCRQRDHAIVQCLSTLGLRPGEVADLRLDDIDWRGGTIEVRIRKNRRSAVLPLPRVVGQVLVDYLSGERPATDERRVFVQHLGARRGKPISSTAVSGVVVRALRRAAVDTPLAGAYVFRHTVASRMVQKGASLKEVADVLGHRSLDTTAIYAKLDLPALREAALPWPEVLR